MMPKKLMGLANCSAVIAFTFAMPAAMPLSYWAVISATVAGAGSLLSDGANAPEEIPSVNQMSLVIVCHIRSLAERPFSPNVKPSLSLGTAAKTFCVTGISRSTP